MFRIHICVVLEESLTGHSSLTAKVSYNPAFAELTFFVYLGRMMIREIKIILQELSMNSKE